MAKQIFSQFFRFVGWQFEPKTGILQLDYHDQKYGDFSEWFQFPTFDLSLYQQRRQGLQRAFEQLFWLAGVSYYKTGLAERIEFAQFLALPSPQQSACLRQTWRSGLAELAFQNGLDESPKADFPAAEKDVLTAEKHNLKARSLVAIGGGKDSLVSIDFLQQQGEELSLFMVGQSDFIRQVAKQTQSPLLAVARTVDSRLKTANQNGAFNGHIPITAINSAVAVVAALLYDYDAIVFSNERSADVGNVQDKKGNWVNHQYSKSFEFERQFQTLIEQFVDCDLSYFSLLRPFSELKIVEQFAQLPQYWPHFSSCNRNFHLTGSRNKNHHWCGDCAKCAFVFLCLAMFIPKPKVLEIFAKNMLDDEQLLPLFSELLGLQGIKPFECVGEIAESRLAWQKIAENPHWKDAKLLQQISVPKVSQAVEKQLLTAAPQQQIPNKRNFRQILEH